MKIKFKFLIYTCLFATILSSLKASAANKTTQPIKVAYREAADFFETMDNVAYWWEGFNEKSYLEAWEKKFGITNKERGLFATYKKIRERYYNDPDQKERDPKKNRNGFFSMVGSAKPDPLASTFYAEVDYRKALKKATFLTSKELTFLSNFYNHFYPKFKELTAGASGYQDQISKIEQTVNNIRVFNFLKKACTFYGIPGSDSSYTVLFTWFPDVGHSMATPVGDFLLMKFNPSELKKKSENNSDIVMHEIMHTYSVRQSFARKQQFTRVYFDEFDIAIEKFKILEEPLAVALGQIYFQKHFQSNRFDIANNWYRDPWINTISRLIFPLVEQYLDIGKTIDEDFVKKSAHLTADLVKSLASLKSEDSEVK